MAEAANEARANKNRFVGEKERKHTIINTICGLEGQTFERELDILKAKATPNLSEKDRAEKIAELELQKENVDAAIERMRKRLNQAKASFYGNSDKEQLLRKKVTEQEQIALGAELQLDVIDAQPNVDPEMRELQIVEWTEKQEDAEAIAEAFRVKLDEVKEAKKKEKKARKIDFQHPA